MLRQLPGTAPGGEAQRHDPGGETRPAARPGRRVARPGRRVTRPGRRVARPRTAPALGMPRRAAVAEAGSHIEPRSGTPWVARQLWECSLSSTTRAHRPSGPARCRLPLRARARERDARAPGMLMRCCGRFRKRVSRRRQPAAGAQPVSTVRAVTLRQLEPRGDGPARDGSTARDGSAARGGSTARGGNTARGGAAFARGPARPGESCAQGGSRPATGVEQRSGSALRPASRSSTMRP
jgi:hypothetical protein